MASSKNKTEFWNSSNFWIPVFWTSLVTCIFILAAGVITWNNKVWGDRQENFQFKDYLLRAAGGEKLDNRKVYLDNDVWAVYSGQALKERANRRISLEDTIKEINNTKAEFKKAGKEGDRKSQIKIEDYKKYLRANYHTEEVILYLADCGCDWENLVSDKDSLKDLKSVLAGNKYVSHPPAYYDGITQYIFKWVMFLQLIVYLISFTFFKDIGVYRNESYLCKARLGVGGFITMLLFSPGALPIIAIQLAIIYVHRFKNYFESNKESEFKTKSIVTSDLNLDSGQALLEKLQQRINTR